MKNVYIHSLKGCETQENLAQRIPIPISVNNLPSRFFNEVSKLNFSANGTAPAVPLHDIYHK